MYNYFLTNHINQMYNKINKNKDTIYHAHTDISTIYFFNK